MIYKFYPNNKKVTYELVIKTNERRKIIVCGYDNEKENTKYFFRELYVNGTDKYYFNCPVSPKQMYFMIYDFVENSNRKSSLFQIVSLKQYDLKNKSFFVDYLTYDYLTLILPFCKKAGYCPLGVYKDAKNQFKIEYYDKIIDDRGSEVLTPARIHKETNEIQVAKSYFDNMTIPSRVMIMLHEYSHNYLNKNMDNESEADINAFGIYLGLNFPIIEGIYAFTQIFTDSSEAMERLNNIFIFLEKKGYKSSKTLKNIFYDYFRFQ